MIDYYQNIDIMSDNNLLIKKKKSELVTPETINFTSLVQNSNTLTTLSKDFHSNLINTLNQEFTEQEQKWYVAQLYTYINFHPTNDFPVNLEHAYKILGLANKANAKRTLKNNFVLDEDYIIILPKQEKQNSTVNLGEIIKAHPYGGAGSSSNNLSEENLNKDSHTKSSEEAVFIPKDENKSHIKLSEDTSVIPKDDGNNSIKTSVKQKSSKIRGCAGLNEETIMLNIDTFKNLCMLVKTDKGKEIRKYYVKLENINNKLIHEELKKHKLQLEQKDSEHTINLKLSRHKLLIEQLKNKKAIYLCEVGENLIKIGSSKDIDDRKQNLKFVFGECTFLDVFDATDDFREIEQNILIKVNEYKYKDPINGHNSKEVVQLTDRFNYNQLKTIVQDEIKNFHKSKNTLTENEFLRSKELDIINKLIDKNMSSDEIIKILQATQKETILIKENEKQEQPIVIGNETLKGRKIQLINPDNLTIIVKVYSSMIHLLKDNNSYDKQAIHNSIKNNTIYKGFRFLFVEHNQNCNVVNDIKETVVSNQPETHIIVQLNKDKNEIINSFNSIKKMKQDFKIGDRKLHKTIDESLLYNDTYFMKIKDCPQALIDKYLLDGNKLASRTSSKSKPIKKINDITKEETIYKSITEAALQSGTSDKSITDSIKNKKLLKGFNWEYIVL